MTAKPACFRPQAGKELAIRPDERRLSFISYFNGTYQIEIHNEDRTRPLALGPA
jgi:hypothetical protein